MILCQTTAYCRVGETLEQCRERYGKEVSTPKEGTYVFIKDAIGMMVIISDKKVDSMTYQGVHGKNLSEVQIKPLLQVNVDGGDWLIDPDLGETEKLINYLHSSKKIEAFYSKDTKVLTVYSKK